MHRCSQYNILNLSVAKSFQNFDNTLRDWAKDEVPKSLDGAVNRYEKQKVKVFSLKKILFVACKYVTRPNYIVNSETKQKPETHDAR